MGCFAIDHGGECRWRAAGRFLVNQQYAGHVKTDIISDVEGDATILQVNSYLRAPAFLSVNPNNGAIADTDLQPHGPFDRASDLAVDEVQVKSWDGTLVPLSIVHRKGIKREGTNIAMLTSYGAYGTSTSPFYVPAMQSWYDHAQIFAFAHVRGGGELGEAWRGWPRSISDRAPLAEMLAKGLFRSHVSSPQLN